MADKEIPIIKAPIRKVVMTSQFASQRKGWWKQPKPFIYKCIGIPFSQQPRSLLSDKDMNDIIAAYHRQKPKPVPFEKMNDPMEISGFEIMPSDSIDFDKQVLTQIPPKE